MPSKLPLLQGTIEEQQARMLDVSAPSHCTLMSLLSAFDMLAMPVCTYIMHWNAALCSLSSRAQGSDPPQTSLQAQTNDHSAFFICTAEHFGIKMAAIWLNGC
jgi:hypothetical protein